VAGTFTQTGGDNGLPGGSRTFGPITIQGAVVIGEVLDLALASGDNTITVPTGAVAVCIIPASGNTTVLKYRTSLNSGDAGLPINCGTSSGYFTHQFPSTAPTSIIINAAEAVSAFTEVWFI
jgi:hypothetical protein